MRHILKDASPKGAAEKSFFIFVSSLDNRVEGGGKIKVISSGSVHRQKEGRIMKYKPSEKSLANLRPPFGKGDKEEERKLQSKGGKAGGAGRVRNNIYRKLFREAFEINEKDIRVGVGNKMIEGDARILELGAKLNGELNPAAVAVDVGVALSASPLADLAKILGKTPTDDEGLQDEVLAKDN